VLFRSLTTEHLTGLIRQCHCIPGRHRTMHRVLPDLCIRNSQGPSRHGMADRQTVRMCMTRSSTSREPERRPEDPQGSDRTGTCPAVTRKRRHPASHLPHASDTVGLSQLVRRNQVSGVRPATAEFIPRCCRPRWSMFDGEIFPPHSPSTCTRRQPGKSPGSQWHRHGVHPYVQHRP